MYHGRVTNPQWTNAAWEVLYELADSDREFTSEDVTAGIPEDITTEDTRALGPIMATALRERRILSVGFTRSPRHGHPKRVYIGNN